MLKARSKRSDAVKLSKHELITQNTEKKLYAKAVY